MLTAVKIIHNIYLLSEAITNFNFETLELVNKLTDFPPSLYCGDMYFYQIVSKFWL